MDQPSVRDTVLAISDVIAGAGVATQHVGGTIGFFVDGDAGGRWVLDLDAIGGSWIELSGDQPEPEVRTAIRARADSFSQIFLTPAVVPELMRAGALIIDGDRRILLGLGELLSAGGSMLELRARGRQS